MYLLNLPLGMVMAGAMIRLADVTTSVLAFTGKSVGDDGKGFPLVIDLQATMISNQKDGKI